MMDSFKALMDTFNSPGASVETFENDTKTIYVVLTTQKGLVLSMRPIIGRHGPVTALIVKVRAHKKEGWANLEEAKPLFGFPFLDRSDQYKMCPLLIPLVLGFSNSIVLSKIISENKLVNKLVGTVYNRLKQAGVPLNQLQDPYKVEEFFEQAIATMLPLPKFDIPQGFPVLIGMKDIDDGLVEETITESGGKPIEG